MRVGIDKRNILLTIEYDGTVFNGWQRQPEALTVQGILERALSLVCGCSIQINGTSRTDAGVHALGQRASFFLESGIPTEKIPYAVNNVLSSDTFLKGRGFPGSVRIVCAEEMPEDFHARFDSKGKKYIYRILNSENISVFDRNYCYHVKKKLDILAMKRAATYLEGTHDFCCFQAAGGQPRETTVRTVFRADVEEDGNEIKISVSGDGFLYNMVRIITGTLVDIGLGKIEPDEMKTIIEGCDRRLAGHTAPPQGLYLVEVFY